MNEVYEWTKRLGQQHWSLPGKNETLCGSPMLGNNYAKHISSTDKIPCRDCQDNLAVSARMDAWRPELNS